MSSDATDVWQCDLITLTLTLSSKNKKLENKNRKENENKSRPPLLTLTKNIWADIIKKILGYLPIAAPETLKE